MLNLIKNNSSTTPVQAAPASLGFGLQPDHEIERLGVCKSRVCDGYPAVPALSCPFNICLEHGCLIKKKKKEK